LLLSLLSPLLLLLLLWPLLRRLLGPLLLLWPLLRRLLGPLLLLRPLLRRLLGPLLLLRPLLRRLLLGMLLLWGWPRFLLLFVLRVRRYHCPEKQKQSAGTCSSSELHCDHPPLSRYWVCTQTASPRYLCSSASAASASAFVLCTVPSGWLGGE